MNGTHFLDGEHDFRPSSLDINPLQLFDIAKSEGRPLYAAAPMVRYSKLAFRETVAQYGVDLTWTPMILAKEFNRSLAARDSDFTLSPTSPPTIAQLGVNSPLEISRTTTLLSPFINGIDINCGCPQSWACAESLGAALMHKRSLVASLITSAKSTFQSLSPSSHSNKTVSVKIRIHKDLRETVDFVRTVQEAGVDFITIHGRTRSTRSSEPVDLEAIKLVAEHCSVPTISNGDVFSLEDVRGHAERTGVDGVMAARGLLENPGLFREDGEGRGKGCEWGVVERFMSEVVRRPVPFKLVVHHLSEMVGSDRGQKGKTLFSKEERKGMMECGSMVELIDFLDEVREVTRL
ncbi:FMN-linked oxidoreductase [Hyaloscypha variabilis]